MNFNWAIKLLRIENNDFVSYLTKKFLKIKTNKFILNINNSLYFKYKQYSSLNIKFTKVENNNFILNIIIFWPGYKNFKN